MLALHGSSRRAVRINAIHTVACALLYNSKMESVVGAVYTGEFDFNGKWSGQGNLRFASGIVYTGSFRDGAFHGEGQLIFPNGAVYKSIWQEGREAEGRSSYQWNDGLPFNIYEGWAYLDGFDRRLWPEVRIAPDGRPNGSIDYALGKKHAQTDATYPPVAILDDQVLKTAVQGVVPTPPKPVPVVPVEAVPPHGRHSKGGRGARPQ